MTGLEGLDVAAIEKESDALVAQIMPLLAGKSPPLQGLVVAELMAIWLAGHEPETRANLRKLQDETVDELLPLWHGVLQKRRTQ